MSEQPQSAATGATMLHRILGMGAVLLAAVMVFLRAKTGMPESELPILGYAIATISLGLVVIAVLVLTPRVPERRAAQSIDEFWKAPANLGPIQLIWFVTEGAAILAAIGYYLTGLLAPAASMVVALGVYWWLGPKMFAKP